VKAGGAEAFAREFGAQVYPNYEGMLADASVMAVDICVPNDLHRRFVEEAAAAGKHILCEKPIALTLADAEAMIAAAEQANVLLMIAHPLRFWEEYVKLHAVLGSIEMGDCQAITMRRMLSLLMSVGGEAAWRRRPERVGGAIIDLQIHDLDFLYWTFGAPETVYSVAVPATRMEFNHCYTTLQYSSGLIAMVESSYLLKGDPMIFTVKAICEGGTLDYQLNPDSFDMHAIEGIHNTSGVGNLASLTCYRSDGRREVLGYQQPEVFDTTFAAEISYFVDCILQKTPNTRVPVNDALATLRIALAAKESAIHRRVIPLDDSQFPSTKDHSLLRDYEDHPG